MATGKATKTCSWLSLTGELGLRDVLNHSRRQYLRLWWVNFSPFCSFLYVTSTPPQALQGQGHHATFLPTAWRPLPCERRRIYDCGLSLVSQENFRRRLPLIVGESIFYFIWFFIMGTSNIFQNCNFSVAIMIRFSALLPISAPFRISAPFKCAFYFK